MPNELVKLIHDENVSIVVIGYARHRGWRRRFREFLVESLFKRLDNVDIHLVELDHDERK